MTQYMYNLDIILTSLVVLITVGFRKLMASPVGFNRANGHQAYTHLRIQDIHSSNYTCTHLKHSKLALLWIVLTNLWCLLLFQVLLQREYKCLYFEYC